MPHGSAVAGALNTNSSRMPLLMAGSGRSSATSVQSGGLSSSLSILARPSKVQRRQVSRGGGSICAHLAPGARAEARRRHAWGAVMVLMAAGGVKQRGRSFPLTSSITLEERKRGSNATAHQYTSHPRFRPAGLYG